jgi:5'-nucleotidase
MTYQDKFESDVLAASSGDLKITILHSNDMHGDFQAEVQGTSGSLVGGLALLSGYITKVRRQEKNVLFVIAGDMLQGSLIDTEYKGVSTIEIMNFLAPDVVTLGNHELDYGLTHLLFLEKMANFPIVNANLFIKKSHKRLMQPHIILNLDGIEILFIGVITHEILESLKKEEIGTFLDLEEAATSVGHICNAYKDDDIDLTVLLTHIGYERDRELAGILNPEWGVDLILGGHSHTILEQPAVINGILIAQAGVGTDQIGRFDIVLDEAANKIDAWTWRLLPINSELTEPDSELQKFIDDYQEKVGQKYSTIICRFARELTHPERDQETELGNLAADIFAQRAGADLALVGSGLIRRKKLGPVVTLGDLKEAFPFGGGLLKLTLTGAQLSSAFAHFMRLEDNPDRIILQVSSGVRAVYSSTSGSLEMLEVAGQPVEDDAHYTVCVLEFHYEISEVVLNLSKQELSEIVDPQVVSTSYQQVIEEYLRNNRNIDHQIEGWLVVK